MNFKDKLKRYQQGVATPQEIEEVKEELAKYESIEEYYADELSEQFLIKEPIEEENKNIIENRGIQKVVNRRLRKVVLISVLSVVALYFGIYYGVSSIVDAFNYNPTEVSVSGDEIYPESDFHFNMAAFISLNKPGYTIKPMTLIESSGFGNYESFFTVEDLFTNELEQHSINISRGQLASLNERVLNYYNAIVAFDEIYFPLSNYEDQGAIDVRKDIIEERNNITLNYLEGLNALSYASLSITFEEDLTMEEFQLLKENYPELAFKWVGVRTTEPGESWDEDQPMWLIGFNPTRGDEDFISTPDSKLYPDFYLGEAVVNGNILPVELYPDLYERHFLTRLNYYSQQTEFIKMMEANSNKSAFYEAALDYVNTNGVETYGVVVYGTADVLLDVTDEISYSELHINESLIMKPQIYNE